MFAWSLFIVIFGGAYWLIRWILEVGNQRGAKRAYDLKIASQKEAREDWIKRVTNIELEKEVTQDMSDEETATKYLCELELASERLKIIDKHLLSCYFISHPSWVNNDNHNAIRVVMANRGYLRYDDAKYGIYDQVSDRVRRGRLINNDEAIIQQNEFILWIDEQLKKHGIEDKLCFRTYGKTYYYSDKLFAFPCKEYLWEPAVLDFKIYEYQPPTHPLDT